MAASHAGSLHLDGDSPLHRLPPECKIVATIAFVFIVVATPREQLWAYAAYAVVLGALVVVAGIPPLTALRRLAIELPFVAFALLLPFLAGGRRVDVGPLAVSADGLWGAWNILIKGTLGVTASVVLTATTAVPALLHGLDRLRAPRAIVQITTFMVRYADVIAGEMHRMRIARLSRGHDPRWFWQAGVVARSAGALFVRSYERGERVHLAMLARGYSGTMPMRELDAATTSAWLTTLAAPACAAVIATTAWLVHL